MLLDALTCCASVATRLLRCMCCKPVACRNTEDASAHDKDVEAYMRKLRRGAAAELQRALVGCKGSVKDRSTGKTPPAVVADDTSYFLRKAEVISIGDWCDYVERTDWLHIICFCRSAALTGEGRGPKLLAAEVASMKKELSKLKQLLYPVHAAPRKASAALHQACVARGHYL